MFYKTKIKRFEVDKSIDPAGVKEDFDLIDSFNAKIAPYIHTKISIKPESDIEVFLQSRIQMFLSQTLLRAIFLKEEIVNSINSNNFPAFYAIVKSFMEIPAQLGYLTYVLYENKPDDEIRKALDQLVFAHRGGLTQGVGTNPISVMTMFDKLDYVLQQIAMTQAQDEQEKARIKKDQAMRTFYEDICNFGHPNYMAHLPIGKIDTNGDWIAKNPSKLKSYKFELYSGFYMTYFTTSIGTILITASMIDRHPKVNHFNKLRSPLLFKSWKSIVVDKVKKIFPS